MHKRIAIFCSSLLLFSGSLTQPAAAQSPNSMAFVKGAEPWTESDCAGDVPILVGSDIDAQSDVYSAITLAGVVGTDCVVLAGPRDGTVSAEQQARLDAAADGGYVLGGTAAVADSKLGERDMKRLGGANRWATAQLVGSEARRLAGGSPLPPRDGSAPMAATTPHPSDAISAASDHTCAVRTAHSVVCWGENQYGQSNAPSGSFAAVSTGMWHTCGLRTDGTITCWGNNSHGQSDDPQGSFSAVSAGDYHTCGLRTDGTVTCWGGEGRTGSGTDADFGQTRAPSGQFTAVSSGNFHTCGLRTDASITCWGTEGEHFGYDTDYGQADAPSGQFIAVTASPLHSCGLRIGGSVTCWGANGPVVWDAPSGSFTAVSLGSNHACALRTNGAVRCWGENQNGQTDAPSDSFTAVSLGFSHTCGLRIEGTVTCWGAEGRTPEGRSVDRGQADAPSGAFGAVATPVRVPGLFLYGAESWVASDCTGDVPIVVGADAKAQSDVYSAITLAGVLGTDCVVLAGPRDGDMAANQRARLATAAFGGYVLGGYSAVPAAKVADRNLKRIGGADRWATAQLVGSEARALADN